MDNSDEPEDLLDGKIVFQKNKDRTFSKTKELPSVRRKIGEERTIPIPASQHGEGGKKRRRKRRRRRIHFERGTQNVEATPKHRANPYRPGAWLFTTDAEATLNRRAALIISPVDPVDRCTALCRSHRRLKHRAAPRLPRSASASGVTGTKF
ncbi:unnamed protein product [Pleuronectes platessa]|uniref:Uncharacterized protein n=1 Tax=Pleuronectes platessa TaxID=8262 RepID=A0A9N7V6I7_PLEPL|nr:unnamed protein product [Pleuronectes platessa]